MENINRYVLPNGLRIVHSYNPLTEIVVVNTLYNVGSKNDPDGKSGCAHLLEHLMFGGSENVSNFDIAVQNAGGENNAYTTADITNYYDIVPAHNIETAFWAESDRMSFLNLNDNILSVQKSVVIEEFKQRNLNRPYGDASAIYRKTAYKRHPYRNRVIGNTISNIESISLEDIRSYYKQYYSPNNAVLSVVGNIKFEQCIKLVEKWYAPLRAFDKQLNNIPKEPLQKKARLKSINRNVPANAIYKVWHISGRNDESYPCYDLISDILANGQSSRLKTNLIKKKRFFFSIDASVTGDIDPGLLIISGFISPEISMEEADKAIENEIEELISHKVPEYEIKKVVNKFESTELFDRTDSAEYAARLAYYELLGNANNLTTLTNKYKSINSTDIMHAAEKNLVSSNCTTLYYNTI